jgi:heterodisulfide reductase subunit B2
MNKYAYFPGCSLHSSAAEYDMSTRRVASKLGLELVEIPDWNCCGAASARSLNQQLDLALNARNLSLASRLQLDILVPCAACYQRLATASLVLQENKQEYEQISLVLGEKLAITSKAKSVLEVFTEEYALNILQREAQKSLSGLKIAAYYGCLLTRSPKNGFDNPEDPVSMDKLIVRIGGEALPWPCKTECCGGSLSLTEPATSFNLIERLLNMAKACGADCIVTACPLCQGNLDMYQMQLSKETGKEYDIPILYFTQLMGLVLGLDFKSMGLQRHFIDPTRVLHRVGLT